MSEEVKKSKRNNVSLLQLISFWLGLIRKFPRYHISVVKALWYINKTNGDKETSIGEYFIKTVNKYPNNKVLLYQDKSWTYKELNEWVNRLANYFISLGFKKGDVAVVLLDNRPEVLAISLALSKIGAVASLINYSQKQQALIHSINLSQAKLVLVGAELIDNLTAIQEELNFPSDKILVVPHEEHKNNSSLNNFEISAKSYSETEPKFNYKIFAKDHAMYVFTSGTTGLPKAAIVSHARWIKGYAGFGLVALQLKDTDVLYVPLPFYHSTAMIVCWTSVVAGGAAMVMKRKFSISEFWEDIKKYKATGFGYVGELCKYLLNAPVNPLEKNNTLTTMVGNGLRPEIWMEFKERFGIEQVTEFYASSEGNLAFVNLFNLDQTMGFSMNKLAIVEYDKEQEAPILNKKGFMKEVGTGGTGLLLGEITEEFPYDGYTEKDKTEKTILRNVLKKGDSYFNTNDLVYNMGYKHTQFVDRLGDTFRWKGENVSTTEVEGIINNFKGIAESIVYGVEIPNNSGRAGMAKLILNESVQSIDFTGFYEFLKKELPSFALPLFLRIAAATETTGTMKYLKSNLKNEGYDCEQTQDSLYFLMPDKVYTLITPEIRDNINKGIYRF